MAVTYKGIVRDNIVIFEDETKLPEGTRVTVIPETPAHRQRRVVSEEELRRRKEACERIEALAERIAKSAKPTLNIGEDVIEARRELEERV